MDVWGFLDTAKGQVLIGGALGAISSAVMEWEGWRAGLRRIVVGFIAAYAFGPVGVPMVQGMFSWMRLPSEGATTAVGYVIGVGGMILVEIILKAWRIRRDNLPKKDEGEE